MRKQQQLREDRQQHILQSEEQRERLLRLTTLASVLQRVSQFLSPPTAGAASSVTITSIMDLTETLFDQFPEEFAIFGLIDLLPDLIKQCLKTQSSLMNEGTQASGWQPLARPDLLVNVASSWAMLSDFFLRRGETALSGQVSRLLHSAMEQEYLPIIRRALTEWNPLQQPDLTENCIALLEAVKATMSVEIFDQLVDMLLIPRLAAAVAAWKPVARSTQNNPNPDRWILPWLPLLRSRLGVLYPDLRRRMAQALSSWNPLAESDRTSKEFRGWAVELFLPWKEVFDASSLESLLVRQVVPKLVAAFRNDLTIRPDSQDLSCFWAVVAWRDLLPPLQLSSILAGEFFPKWISALTTWLTCPGVDLGEVGQWYTGWKELLSDLMPQLVERDEAILGYFNLALELMQAAMEGEGDWEDGVDTTESEIERRQRAITPFQSALGAISSSSYLKQLELRRVELRQASTATATTASSAAFTSSAPASSAAAFKELVTTFAERNGVSFAPKVGRMAEGGQQLWQFGRCLCFLEQSVVFVAVESNQPHPSTVSSAGRKWVPVDLEELLKMAQ